jgi:hypothetical protein
VLCKILLHNVVAFSPKAKLGERVEFCNLAKVCKVDVINQLTMGTKPMESIINEWDLSVLQQSRGQQVTVALKGWRSVLAECGQHGMGITLCANIILIAATILLDAIVVCQRVGANGSQTLKLA